MGINTKTGFTVSPLKGDASDRSYFRVKFDSPDAFPRSIVLMKLLSPFKEDEQDFITLQKFLRGCKVPVPEIYMCSPGRGFIYLEDCGDELMSERLKRAPGNERVDLYRKAIDILLVMQIEGTRKMEETNPARGRRFDAAKYMEELRHTLKYFVEGFRDRKITGADRKRLESAFLRLVGPLENEPMIFTHRDYRSRNIMIRDGRLRVLDFQDARMGPPHYDTASLLFDSYYRLDDDERTELTGYYVERWNMTSRNGFKRDDFTATLCRAALQRNLKALGTFGYQAVKKNRDFYLRFVPDTVEYIRRNIRTVEELKEDAGLILSLIGE